jgi:hypothetical protein
MDLGTAVACYRSGREEPSSAVLPQPVHGPSGAPSLRRPSRRVGAGEAVSGCDRSAGSSLPGKPSSVRAKPGRTRSPPWKSCRQLPLPSSRRRPRATGPGAEPNGLFWPNGRFCADRKSGPVSSGRGRTPTDGAHPALFAQSADDTTQLRRLGGWPAASRIKSPISRGCEIRDRWLAFNAMVFAFIRSAMKRSRSGLIVRSSVDTA